MIPAAKVVQHYGESDQRHRLRAALTAAGLDSRPLSALGAGRLTAYA
jgi:hypothetical protein